MKKKIKLYDVPKISSIQDMILNSAKSYGEKLALEDLQEYPISKLTFNELLSNILNSEMP